MMTMTCGAAAVTVTVNAVDDVAVPPGAVTVITPVVAVAGTVVLICRSEVTVKVAAIPWNFTDVAPVNPDPEMVTGVPTGPLVGLKPVITVGGGPVVTVNEVDDGVLMPPCVVTLIGPVLVPLGAVAVTFASETNAKVVAATPLVKVTPVRPVNPEPLIVTDVPTGPLDGLKVVIEGSTVNDVVELPVTPSPLVTVIGPVVAPVGTVVVIWISLFTVKAGWLVPLNFTAVAPVKPEPLIVTDAPSTPLLGLKLVITGGGPDEPTLKVAMAPVQATELLRVAA
jgi:hypothetical protein